MRFSDIFITNYYRAGGLTKENLSPHSSEDQMSHISVVGFFRGLSLFSFLLGYALPISSHDLPFLCVCI